MTPTLTQQALEQNKPHATPYCSDPECSACRQLRETQDAIRVHQSIPARKQNASGEKKARSAIAGQIRTDHIIARTERLIGTAKEAVRRSQETLKLSRQAQSDRERSAERRMAEELNRGGGRVRS